MSVRDTPPPVPDYGERTSAGDRLGTWDGPAEPRTGRGLADQLEPGALRDELLGPQDVGRPEASSPRAARVARLRFTGEGREYFRIWIVNLFLILVTLGVYSAWAKVRKTRYFWQNTRLEEHAFDYHGNPRAILIGRVIAVLLLIGYTFAFDISRGTALTMAGLLCLTGPWLFMRAQRFRLANTSWRGLRFGFFGSARDAYRSVLPPILIWLSGPLALVLGGASALAGLLGALPGLLFPWMHHRLKRFQRVHARYGERRFAFVPATGRFYAVYMLASLLALGGLLGGLFGAWMLLAFLPVLPEASPDAAAVVIAASAVVGYLVAWPYFSARLQAVVWSHTSLGDVRFATAIAAGPLLRLSFVNVTLTLATLGLYWPFAAVALARYRVECMRVESTDPLEALAGETLAPPGSAAGDAAVDAFGVDIGL